MFSLKVAKQQQIRFLPGLFWKDLLTICQTAACCQARWRHLVLVSHTIARKEKQKQSRWVAWKIALQLWHLCSGRCACAKHTRRCVFVLPSQEKMLQSCRRWLFHATTVHKVAKIWLSMMQCSFTPQKCITSRTNILFNEWFSGGLLLDFAGVPNVVAGVQNYSSQ